MQLKSLSTSLIAASLALAGCGNNNPTSGVFLDSQVQGLSYTSASASGTTDASGRFTCYGSETVNFSLGGINLGSASCAGIITPQALASGAAVGSDALDNRLLFLQSLDEDDDPANGIVITPAVAAAMAGKSLNFGLAATSFNADLAALLPANISDRFGNYYSARSIDDNRRLVAREHFSGTLAMQGSSGAARSVTGVSGALTSGQNLLVTSYHLQAANSLFVPYTGSNALISADFPNGFYPAAGSGMAYRGKAADGSLEFLAITDRGPNGDGPKGAWSDGTNAYSLSKVFPAPAFAPSIGLISVGSDGAVLKSLTPLMVDATTKVTGLPLPAGSVGATGEIALSESMATFNPASSGFDANGLDTESMVIDSARNVLWTSDEYGPFIVKLDASNYRVLAKYAPGSGLPAVLAKRRANRGMEGLTLDSAGKLHGFLQSPIDPLAAGKSVKAVDSLDRDGDGNTTETMNLKDFAQFARWVEFDPDSATSKTYAYPLTYAYAATGGKWDRSRTGSTKLGDMVALGNGKFLVIEQGSGTNADGTSALAVHNYLMLVEIPADVTDISADDENLEKNSIDGSTASTHAWSNVVTLKKTLLLDLNAAGWVAEKAEGLTLVDATTLALINDNDFGLRTVLYDASGAALAGSIEDCTVDANGAITDAGTGSCPAGAVTARVTRGLPVERATRLWLIKFPQALSSYAIP